jgi:thiol-disulfide isomerase/thioredoxin
MVTRIARLLAVTAAAALGPAPRLPAQIAPGDAFPALSAAALGAAPLPATAGQVTLVDFWASWCAPCKASFPAYSRLQSDYRARGLVVVAVSVDEGADAYAAFVARLKPTFRTARDAHHLLVAQVQVPTMPTCYLVDRAGRVRFVHPGFHGDATERQLRAEVERLLAEPAPAP